jgi:WD40 repeat protein
LAALAVPVGATGDLASTQKTPRTVLAIEHGEQTSFLVRLDARSLKPVSRRVPLGGFVCASASSPNGRRLALAMCVDDAIRIFDARRLKHVAAIRSRDRYTSVLAWPAPRRVVWLGADRVFTADPI